MTVINKFLSFLSFFYPFIFLGWARVTKDVYGETTVNSFYRNTTHFIILSHARLSNRKDAHNTASWTIKFHLDSLRLHYHSVVCLWTKKNFCTEPSANLIIKIWLQCKNKKDVGAIQYTSKFTVKYSMSDRNVN